VRSELPASKSGTINDVSKEISEKPVDPESIGEDEAEALPNISKRLKKVVKPSKTPLPTVVHHHYHHYNNRDSHSNQEDDGFPEHSMEKKVEEESEAPF